MIECLEIIIIEIIIEIGKEGKLFCFNENYRSGSSEEPKPRKRSYNKDSRSRSRGNFCLIYII